jgi:uncharacterized BrkB/YihY/UPF0761 family membrane protein
MIRSCAIRRLSAIDPGPTTTRKDRFSVYLAYFVDYGTTYGSLGAAIGLLFYLYLSAAVVLVGAEVNAVVYHHGIDKRGRRRCHRVLLDSFHFSSITLATVGMATLCILPRSVSSSPFSTSSPG